ncbi:oxidoreductase family protein [Setomelanomma holmii]|uniref:Oxidoreductase family protein n=1 Tax=Setomelanomma holmii TaxID=210430 RepID=A0A9P4HKD8_9PLEO|nr:oxidoreductase family protein [Setomelanomma holmii]
MAPIRVALVGLSASAKTSWAADAHLPYLLSERGRSHYKLVALLNSSVKAAQATQQEYKLDPSIKTYGDPDDLAADPNVDLVVVNTRVDVHFSTAEPSIRAGKPVYIEWPLTENFQRALELTKSRGLSNSIVGLQGRVTPLILRIKQILAEGAIGQVYNSEVKAYGTLLERDALPESLLYFADRKVGGHPINIHYGHMIDYVHEVLGDWEDFQSKMQIQRPILNATAPDGSVTRTIKSDVPDFITVHGTLKPGKTDISAGALLSVTFRAGQALKGQPGFTWTINGSKGELVITAPGLYLMSGDSYDGPVKIYFHDHESDEMKELEWDWEGWQKELGLRARSTAAVYERYARWIESGKGEVQQRYEFPTLEDGVRLMKEFDKLYRQHDPNW